MHIPSNQGVFTVVMKNWDPFVFGPAETYTGRMPSPNFHHNYHSTAAVTHDCAYIPALAMERSPGLVCLMANFSSLNVSP